MFAKRCALPLFLALCAVFPLAAANVSLMVIETGLSEESGVNQHSGLWESGMLDVFFESGHIVSNAPMLRLDYAPAEVFPEEAFKDRDEALEGGVEFFVLALVDYQNREEDNPKPKNISLRLFRTQPWAMIYETQYTDTKSQTVKEEYDSLRQAVRGLIPRLK